MQHSLLSFFFIVSSPLLIVSSPRRRGSRQDAFCASWIPAFAGMTQRFSLKFAFTLSILFIFYTSATYAADDPPSRKKLEDYPLIEQILDEIAERTKGKRKLEWKGNIKIAFRFAKSRERRADNTGGFELSALNIKWTYSLHKDITLRGHYQIDPIQSDLRETFVEIREKKGIINRWRMGLQKRVLSLDSDLETDSLNKIAFYKMRDLGIVGRVRLGKQWQWNFGLFNGGRLDTRDISARRTLKQDIILSDDFDRRQAFGTNSRELVTSIRYRYRYRTRKTQKGIEATLFASTSPISDDDAADFETLSDVPGFTGTNTGNTTYTKWGINAEWRVHNIRAFSQYIVAKVRELERQLFTTEWGYGFKKVRWIIGYSQQQISVRPDPLSPLSWFRERYTLGYWYRWKKNATFALELTVNEEDTGADPITNDEALAAWIYSF